MIATTRNGAQLAVNHIRLDGTVVANVIVADESTGTIVRHKTDEKGLFVRDGERFATETLHGDVRIDLFPGWEYVETTASYRYNRGM